MLTMIICILLCVQGLAFASYALYIVSSIDIDTTPTQDVVLGYAAAIFLASIVCGDMYVIKRIFESLAT